MNETVKELVDAVTILSVLDKIEKSPQNIFSLSLRGTEKRFTYIKKDSDIDITLDHETFEIFDRDGGFSKSIFKTRITKTKKFLFGLFKKECVDEDNVFYKKFYAIVKARQDYLEKIQQKRVQETIQQLLDS